MREAALWASGAALAFLATAGAFLILANLATGSPGEGLAPAPAPGKPGPDLDLDLSMDQLASLRPEPDQELRLTLENTGGTEFSSVNLTLEYSSGDTANPQSRYYRQTVQNLAPGESVEARFLLDLSHPVLTDPAKPREESRILEIRATTPEGVSAVRTVILPM